MKLRTAIATATTAAVLATSGIAIAGASSSSTSQPTTPTSAAAAKASGDFVPAAARRGRARRLIRRANIRRHAAAIITKTIGIDRKMLRSELAGGKTIAQIATDHNVQPQAVIQALLDAARTRLAAAVKADKISADRAAKIEGKLPARIDKLVNDWHPKGNRTGAAA